MADLIREVIAQRLQKGLRDPRMGYVTITDVQVSGDLQHATVFYTVLGSPEEQEDTHAALLSATGLLRSEVGRQTGIKFTPTLAFIPDAVPENARHVEDLLAQAAAADAAVHERAAQARYAGDADPYRHPAE